MRAQATLEFLIDFLIVLAVLGVLLTALQGVEKRTREGSEAYTARIENEGEARMLDELGTGLNHARIEGGGYRVDAHEIRREYRGEWVLVETLYGGAYAQEPV